MSGAGMMVSLIDGRTCSKHRITVVEVLLMFVPQEYQYSCFVAKAACMHQDQYELFHFHQLKTYFTTESHVNFEMMLRR